MEEKWSSGDVTYEIKWYEGSCIGGHYCGYCTFPERPVKEESYSGILTYVPVHGGITFARETPEGFTYGFDCAHAGDESNPQRKDMSWLKSECVHMEQGIRIAALYEDRYLAAATECERAEVLDAYYREMCAKGVMFDLEDNLGALINSLTGKL